MVPSGIVWIRLNPKVPYLRPKSYTCLVLVLKVVETVNWKKGWQGKLTTDKEDWKKLTEKL